MCVNDSIVYVVCFFPFLWFCRSHAILTVHVESRISGGASSGTATVVGNPSSTSQLNSSNVDDSFVVSSGGNVGGGGGGGDLRLGKMHLIDLAGSERLALSGAEGDTLVETQSINLSLAAIGD